MSLNTLVIPRWAILTGILGIFWILRLQCSASPSQDDMGAMCHSAIIIRQINYLCHSAIEHKVRHPRASRVRRHPREQHSRNLDP